MTRVGLVLAGLGHLALLAAVAAPIAVPKTWDDTALHDWATPVAGVNVRPGHFSEAEYYRAPVDNLRTYPVYFPGREPAGYWDMLHKIGPKPLIEPATLSTDADWIAAGKRVFEELDTIGFRTFDAKAIALAREPAGFAKSDVAVNPDGTLPDLRWVPTSNGVALGLVGCAECHVATLPDGTRVPVRQPINRAVRSAALASVSGVRRRFRCRVRRCRRACGVRGPCRG